MGQWRNLYKLISVLDRLKPVERRFFPPKQTQELNTTFDLISLTKVTIRLNKIRDYSKVHQHSKDLLTKDLYSLISLSQISTVWVGEASLN